MTDKAFKYIYGPVDSRRLGSSLGVDVVPFKICTYDCTYCQLGRTTDKTIELNEFVPLDDVVAEIERKLKLPQKYNYISISGSGEPTLYSRIGELINRIKDLTRLPVAVLTNGSLLFRKDVQDDLMGADLVLPSLDAGNRRTFKLVNRPHWELDFDTIVEGIMRFTECFPGVVWLEVLLLEGTTGTELEVEKIADLAELIGPDLVQLNTATRPTCEINARPVSEKRLQEFAKFFKISTEVITENQHNLIREADNHEIPDSEILALLSRRPCTALGVAHGLGIHVNEATKRLSKMEENGSLKVLRGNNAIHFEVKRTENG
jgi:wyosine [tRNA(Phe)-imidazoG37] synthetase (radical SAM superfamily)